MQYYVFIENKEITGKGQCKQLTDGIENIPVTEDVFNNLDQYIYQDGEIILNPNYEEEQAQKEQERILMLSLTAADVERAIYKAKGMDFEDIIKLVEQSNSVDEQNVTNSSTIQPFNLSTPIDIKALKIELKANNFYRGNPYVDIVGNLLGYTSEDLDYLFEHKSLPEKIVEVEND